MECLICGEQPAQPATCRQCKGVFCLTELLDHFRARRFWCPRCRTGVSALTVKQLQPDKVQI